MVEENQQAQTEKTTEEDRWRRAEFRREVRLYLIVGLLLLVILGAWYLLHGNWNLKDYKQLTYGMTQDEVKKQLNLILYKRISGHELAKWKSYKSRTSPNTGGYIEPKIVSKIAEIWQIPRFRILYGEFMNLCFDHSQRLCYKEVDEFMIGYPATAK